MSRYRFLFTLIPLLVAACATSQQGPIVGSSSDSIDPRGVYEYQTVIARTSNGGTVALSEAVSGAIRIERRDGGYGGTISVSGRSPMPISSIDVDRNNIRIQARDGEGSQVVIRFVVQGSSFSGEWIDADRRSFPLRGSIRN